MRKLMKYSLFMSLLGIIFLINGCQKDDQTGQITFIFDHEVQGKSLEFNQFDYLSPAGHPYSVTRLKYYISEMELTEENGTIVSLPGVHYREVGVPETEQVTYIEIPQGKYTKLDFIYGLDEVTNVDGGLPNTTTNINMEWPIPGDQGYHYMKFEGKYDSLASGIIKNFNLHTGATKGNQNYLRISMPLNSFNLVDENWEIKLMMDLNEWMQNPMVYDFETFGPMIMANQNAQDILKANGVSVFSVESVQKIN